LNARVVKPMRRLLFLAAVLVLAGCEPIPAARAQAVSLDTDKMVQAIYRAEGGEKTRFPYGVMSVKCASKADAERVCRNTVVNNWNRWIKAGQPGEFVVYLAGKYCPVSADPVGNRRWIANVSKFYQQ